MMNKWVQKSIEIANAPGYLDRLSEVYRVMLEAERTLPPGVKFQLKGMYDDRDGVGLIKASLKLDKFPVNDPYVAFLRKRKGIFLDYNPETVNRIANRMFSLDFDELVEGCEEPKAFSK